MARGNCATCGDPSIASVRDCITPFGPCTDSGASVDRDMVEKVALLRARLSLDNSALIKLAIEDLYRKHETKRVFGDA